MVKENSQDNNIKSKIEVALLVSDKPLNALSLAKLLDLDLKEVESNIAELIDYYQNSEHGFEIRETKNGYAFFSKSQYSQTVAQILGINDTLELSQPALDTLAVIAYQGPISKYDISQIRGVNADAILRNLLNMGLIEKKIDPENSRAFLFSISDYALEQIGISDLSELPPIAPYLPKDLNELGITDEFKDIRKKKTETEINPEN